MKTEKEWDQIITNITLKIHQEYPELSKYITEMPIKVSEKNTSVINIQNQEEYYNSLVNMVREYSKTHAGIKVNNDTETVELVGYPLYSSLDVPGSELDDDQESV